MLTGFKLDEDDLVTSLLDQGLRVAFFKQVENQDEDEAEMLGKVLASFPRNRVGVSTNLNINDISSTCTPSKLQQTMTETVSLCADKAMSLYFEVTANSVSGKGCNSETEKEEYTKLLKSYLSTMSKELASHSKTLVKNFEKAEENRGKRLILYLHFNFPGVQIDENLATNLCTVMRESVHVAVNSKMLSFQGRKHFLQAVEPPAFLTPPFYQASQTFWGLYQKHCH